MIQKLNFHNCNIEAINKFREAPKHESKTEGAQVKLTATQKVALASICKENGIGVSTFISDALDCYFEIFEHREKVKRHGKLLSDLLSTLP